MLYNVEYWNAWSITTTSRRDTPFIGVENAGLNRQAHCSNLGWDTDYFYHDIHSNPAFLKGNLGPCLKFSHDCFLQHSLQFSVRRYKC
jgi:hypothetical protein